MPIKLKPDDFKKKTATKSAQGVAGFVKAIGDSSIHFNTLLKTMTQTKEQLKELLGASKKMQQQIQPQPIQQPIIQQPQSNSAPPPAIPVPNQNQSKVQSATELINETNGKTPKQQATLIYDEGEKMIATVQTMDMPQFVDSYKTYKDLIINKLVEILQ